MDIFKIEHESGLFMLDQSYYADTESDHELNGKEFSEIWNQLLTFQDVKNDYDLQEAELDQEEAGIDEQIVTFVS